MEKEIDANEVLKYMRETVGLQAQEIAVLKTALEQYTANS
jgi:hypothetical protein